MKLTGVFKDYAGLRLAYGLDTTDPVDREFDSFLKIIADKECVLTNYRAINQTFDTTLFIEDPERPGSGKMVYDYLDGRSRRYGDNMGIDKLDSVTAIDADQDIYCTQCGFQISKETRYDYEPIFTYGDIYSDNIDGHPDNPVSITGTKISLKAYQDGLMMCPIDRRHTKWDEVGNTLP